MSTIFRKRHLRVETPQTIDGINLKLDGKGKPVTKISVLPVSAKRKLERNFVHKPKHLKPTITEVEGDADVQKKKTKGAEKIK